MDPKQTSQIKLKDGKYVFFAEVAHALEYHLKNKEKVAQIWVKDAQTGKWIDGTKAFYVETPDTPMGHGLLAFESRIKAVSQAKGKKVYSFRDINQDLLKGLQHRH